jgi:hypothetical protein
MPAFLGVSEDQVVEGADVASCKGIYVNLQRNTSKNVSPFTAGTKSAHEAVVTMVDSLKRD